MNSKLCGPLLALSGIRKTPFLPTCFRATSQNSCLNIIMKIWDLPSTEEDAVVFFHSKHLLLVTKRCEQNHECFSDTIRCNILACPSKKSIQSGFSRNYRESKCCSIGSLAKHRQASQAFNVGRQAALRSDDFLEVVRVLHHPAKSLKTDSTSSNEKNKPNEPEKISIFKKFKSMYRDYWYVLVPVHLVTSAFWFGAFYYTAKSGIDIAALAEKVHLSDETVSKIRANSNTLAGHLAVSYLLYKVFTPLRYTVTVGGTTISINYLKKWGYIRPMPKKEDIKKMLEEKRVSFRKKKENFRVRKDLMKKNVIEKLSQKKRTKKTAELIRRVLHRRINRASG